MTMSALEKTMSYTYNDYVTWDSEPRVELINGNVYAMAAPSPKHQDTLLNLALLFGNFLKGKSCKPFIAPIDVRLNYEYGDDTVVRPDLIVVCDKNRITDKSINGVPDLIVEILSPSTANIDKILKLNKYIEAGVKEYWIVDTADKTVYVYILQTTKLSLKAYSLQETDKEAFEPTHDIKVGILEGLTVNLHDIFDG